LCLPFIEHVFTLLHMLGALFFCYFPSVLNEWLLHVDNEQYMVLEGVIGDFHEHQHGEGNYPLTHYFLHTL
jgi:hypothetical protein